jgi:hypothetical protein
MLLSPGWKNIGFVLRLGFRILFAMLQMRKQALFALKRALTCVTDRHRVFLGTGWFQ